MTNLESNEASKVEWIYQGVKPITRDKGFNIILEIVHEWTCAAEHRGPEHVTIIQFGKYFYNLEEVENFKKTLLYKQTFKVVVETCEKYQK